MLGKTVRTIGKYDENWLTYQRIASKHVESFVSDNRKSVASKLLATSLQGLRKEPTV